MDSIQIVCEECFFIELGESAMEASRAGAVISYAIQRAKRTISNILQRIMAAVRNILNAFRKNKRIYLPESTIKIIHRSITLVNEGTSMIDDLPSINSIQRLTDSEQVSEYTDKAYDAANQLRRLTNDLDSEIEDKVLTQKYCNDMALDGKLVHYERYSADLQLLSNVESRMKKLVDDINTSKDKAITVTSKYRDSDEDLSEYGKNTDKIDHELGTMGAVGRFLQFYYSAYGSATVAFLRLISQAQRIINIGLQLSRSHGIKAPDDIKRDSKYHDTEVSLTDDD